VGSFARWSQAADYDGGWSSDAVARLREYIEREWGAGETIRAIVESRASDPEIEIWARRAEQHGASPGAALDLLDMNLQIDVRPLLTALGVPVVVMHHTADAVIDVENGRYLARNIPGARLVEVAGRDHVFFFEDREGLIDAVRWLMHRRESEGHRERFLTTVLVVEVEDDRPFDRSRVVSEFRGSPIGRALAWHFDGPQRAIACGHALVGLREAEGSVRVGIHTGEVTRQGRDITGEAVDTAVAVAHAAAPAEVRVTRVVRDLVHGADLIFDAPAEVAAGDGRTLVTFASEPPPG
jgi:class 3 adenylate cyclase